MAPAEQEKIRKDRKNYNDARLTHDLDEFKKSENYEERTN